METTLYLRVGSHQMSTPGAQQRCPPTKCLETINVLSVGTFTLPFGYAGIATHNASGICRETSIDFQATGETPGQGLSRHVLPCPLIRDATIASQTQKARVLVQEAALLYTKTSPSFTRALPLSAPVVDAGRRDRPYSRLLCHKMKLPRRRGPVTKLWESMPGGSIPWECGIGAPTKTGRPIQPLDAGRSGKTWRSGANPLATSACAPGRLRPARSRWPGSRQAAAAAAAAWGASEHPTSRSTRLPAPVAVRSCFSRCARGVAAHSCLTA